jgi:hypothetical protein
MLLFSVVMKGGEIVNVVGLNGIHHSLNIFRIENIRR